MKRAAKLLYGGRADAAICYFEDVHAHEAAKPSFSGELYLVGDRSHIRETGQHIMIPDLVDMPLILPRDSWFRNHLDDAFVAEGVTILPYSNIYAEIERNEVCCRPITGINAISMCASPSR